jgi:menaquinone-dependent protoporphyrinogen oxidase
MTRVLVVVASRHGATRNIAGAIADELRSRKLDADLADIDDINSLDRVDALVLGSAVYMGGWLPAARAFAKRFAVPLARIPLWLFSSGPTVPEGATPGVRPKQVDELARTLHARDHRVFAGRLEPDELGFGERLVSRMVYAPAGDFRDWDEIRSWAAEIAEVMRHEPIAAQTDATQPPDGLSGTESSTA